MASKMWAGRFSKETDEKVNDFNSSVSFDSRMYKQDIEGSAAHARMLGKTGIIQAEESERIIAGLKGILSDLESGALEIDPEAEDIHMFVEKILTERTGEAGKRLHTARSRNDQVALDARMYVRSEIKTIISLIRSFLLIIIKISEENLETVMPGYTHMQRAQPVTLAHHLMAYAQMFLRDMSRLEDCYERTDEMPLGSGALAGTTHKIDREAVREELSFRKITENSLDGVSDRDFMIEFVSALSLIMMHLSRLSEEIILWCSWEFKFVSLDDAYATGSSIMPQKKNPDVAELVRGKTGRVYGALITLLTVMKGIPLAYNKDMQEDKEAVFGAADTVKLCLETIAPMIETMTVNKENMRAAAAKGFINATDCADYLVKKGMAFRDAYKITGEMVAYCIKENKTLEELSMRELSGFSEIFGDDVYDALSLEACVKMRDVAGGPSPGAVKKQILNVRKRLDVQGG